MLRFRKARTSETSEYLEMEKGRLGECGGVVLRVCSWLRVSCVGYSTCACVYVILAYYSVTGINCLTLFVGHDSTQYPNIDAFLESD